MLDVGGAEEMTQGHIRRSPLASRAREMAPTGIEQHKVKVSLL